MARTPCLFAVLFLALAVGTAQASENKRIVGPGYAFDLPDRFSTEAGPWEVVARATCETLVQGMPFRPLTEPRLHFYAVPGKGGREAILVVCRFDLGSADALSSVADLPLTSIRDAFQHTMDTLPGGQLLHTISDDLGGRLPAVVASFRYPHPAAGDRTVQSAVLVRERTGLLLLLDAPTELKAEYQAYFESIGASLKLLRPAPSLMEQLRYPIYGLAGLLCLLLVTSIVIRTRRARRQARLAAATPHPLMRVISVDEGLDAPPPKDQAAELLAAATEEPAAALEGTFLDEMSATAPDGAFSTAPPETGSVTAAPASAKRPGLRASQDGVGDELIEPAPMRRTDPQASEPEVREATAEEDEPERKPRISRNADFLQG